MNKTELNFLCRFIEILGWEDLPFTQVIHEIMLVVVEAASDVDAYDAVYDFYPQELINRMLTSVFICNSDGCATPTYDEVMAVYNNRHKIAELMRNGYSFEEAAFEVLDEL